MSTKVTCRENGPILLNASAAYIDADGNPQTKAGKSIALCRCGASVNKPFCDGTHRKINFEAPQIELDVTLTE